MKIIDNNSTILGDELRSSLGRGIPAHLGIEPDRQRSAALERFVMGRAVPGLVGRCCWPVHATQLPRWIREMNPSLDLCNRAEPNERCSQHDACINSMNLDNPNNQMSKTLSYFTLYLISKTLTTNNMILEAEER